MEISEVLEILEKKGKKDKYISIEDLEAYYTIENQEYWDIMDKLKEKGIDVLSKEQIDALIEEKAKELEADLEPDEELLSSIDVQPEEIDKEIHKISSSSIVDDPVRQYINDIGKFPLLSQEEEINLAGKIKKGKIAEEKLNNATENGITLSEEEMKDIQKDMDIAQIAKEKLINSNLKLVIHTAKPFTQRGLPFLDLIQEGNMGLMKAADKFDPEKGCRFSTYATWWIRQSISRAVADQGRTIRIPVHMVETVNKMLKTKRLLTQELGTEPTTEQIAEKMGISEDKVQEILKISQQPTSLEKPIGEEQDSSMGDLISDPNTLTPYEYTALEMKKKLINEVLSTLPEREEMVLRMRYGLLDGRERTLEEIGREFDITRERVRQIESKALKKLNALSRSNQLKDL